MVFIILSQFSIQPTMFVDEPVLYLILLANPYIS